MKSWKTGRDFDLVKSSCLIILLYKTIKGSYPGQVDRFHAEDQFFYYVWKLWNKVYVIRQYKKMKSDDRLS
jgi:hypothetical protein